MPTWNEIDRQITDEIAQNRAATVVCDEARLHYLRELSAYRKRAVIAYYSGFLQKRLPNGTIHPECAISDFDMNGFMAIVYNIPRDRGLDFIIHTPGGGAEATRALVEYLYKMFGKNIEVIVPQMAMSAGTMIACAARLIHLGKHSCLGPTDPHINGHAAMGVLHEIDKALSEIRAEPMKQLVWQEVFRKFPPGFIVSCERSRDGTTRMVHDWLVGNMFRDFDDRETRAQSTVAALIDITGTTGHDHHYLPEKCTEMGLSVAMLEDDQELQERVLSVHHSYVASFARVRSLKFIENSEGASWNVAG